MSLSNIHPKTKANAISSYLMIFMSLGFLINKENPYINNDFVKSHTKHAFILHIAFFATYIIFVIFDIIPYFEILDGIYIEQAITGTIFTLIFLKLLHGIYTAHKWEHPNTNIKIFKTQKNNFLNTSEKSISEREKAYTLISLIPFISFLFVQEKPNTITENNTKLALIWAIIISLLYISGNTNFLLIFTLIYIIYTCFFAVNLYGKESVIQIQTSYIPSPKSIQTYMWVFFIYIWAFIKWKEPETLKVLAEKQRENIPCEELKNLRDTSIPKVLLYIPIINIAFLKTYNTKYRYHFVYGILLAIISIFTAIISIKWLILIVIPICFGIGYAKISYDYKMPFLYPLYKWIESIIKWCTKKWIKAKQLHKTDTVTTFKTEK